MQHIIFEELAGAQKDLLLQAEEASKNFLNVKGSRYVGAALLGKNGKVYVGTSIRRTTASNSTCAERMAIDKALFERCYDYEGLAIIGFCKDFVLEEVISPCGTCRQIIVETLEIGSVTDGFFPIILSNATKNKIIITSIQELLPLAYTGYWLKK
jgi:cytidine deaminase